VGRVSDLQCPFRVLLARHGEAEYETPLFMDHGGSLTTSGRAQARELGKRLRSEQIAHVYSSTISRAVQTAELAAGVLGVEVTVREGLMELALGDHRGQPAGTGVFDPVVRAWTEGDVEARAPGSESAVEIAARVRTVLDDLADQHRGESVLVVTHGGAVVATVAVLAYEPGRSPDVPNGSYVVLERDVDGWRLG
jgi:2,3-bisphosphoglycerate-dependent phosphoglycerate mutase